MMASLDEKGRLKACPLDCQILDKKTIYTKGKV